MSDLSRAHSYRTFFPFGEVLPRAQRRGRAERGQRAARQGAPERRRRRGRRAAHAVRRRARAAGVAGVRGPRVDHPRVRDAGAVRVAARARGACSSPSPSLSAALHGPAPNQTATMLEGYAERALSALIHPSTRAALVLASPGGGGRHSRASSRPRQRKLHSSLAAMVATAATEMARCPRDAPPTTARLRRGSIADLHRLWAVVPLGVGVFVAPPGAFERN